MPPLDQAPQLSRRKVLVAGAGAAVAASALAACGSGDPSPAEPAAGGSSAKAGGDAGPAGALARVSDIPVGGAVSAETSDGKPVIVSQPSQGQIVAFSAICTHQGCTVAPAASIIRCPCHGSTYDLATGANTGGPAPKPLAEVAVKVTGGDVLEA
jgi:cytochrome b6-f complex iron-sulfur subunit